MGERAANNNNKARKAIWTDTYVGSKLIRTRGLSGCPLSDVQRTLSGGGGLLSFMAKARYDEKLIPGPEPAAL